MADKTSVIAKIDLAALEVQGLGVITPPVGAFPVVTLYPTTNTQGVQRMLFFRVVKNGRYFRYQEPVEFKQNAIIAATSLTGGVVKPLDFECIDHGGTAYPFQSPVYKLLVGGIERDRINVTAGQKRGVFSTGLFGNETDKEYLFEIQPCNADGTPDTRGLETNAPTPFIVNRGGNA
jgi:hypothetical protein